MGDIWWQVNPTGGWAFLALIYWASRHQEAKPRPETEGSTEISNLKEQMVSEALCCLSQHCHPWNWDRVKLGFPPEKSRHCLNNVFLSPPLHKAPYEVDVIPSRMNFIRTWGLESQMIPSACAQVCHGPLVVGAQIWLLNWLSWPYWSLLLIFLLLFEVYIGTGSIDTETTLQEDMTSILTSNDISVNRWWEKTGKSYTRHTTCGPVATMTLSHGGSLMTLVWFNLTSGLIPLNDGVPQWNSKGC